MKKSSHFKLKTTILNFIRIILIVFLIVGVIYNSGYAMITLEQNLSIPLLVLSSVIVFILLVFKKSIKDMKVNLSLFVYIGLLMGLSLSLISNMDFLVLNSYVRFLFVISLGYGITQIITFKRFVNIFVNVMKIVSLISLFFYILNSFFSLSLPFTLITNTNGISYLNGYLFFLMEHAPERNTGIFWEPGIFSSFLIIALVCEICFKKTINKLNILLFTITLLTTLSTAGYFLIILVALLFLNRKSKQDVSIIINAFILVPLIVIFLNSEKLFLYLSSIFPYLLSKVVNSSNSVSTRIGGPLIDLEIFSKSPIFGVGFKTYQIEWGNLAYQFDVSAQTSTITYFMATLGILGFLYLLAWFYGILKFRELNIISRAILLFIFVLILSKEPHQHNVTMYIFLFYFLNGKESIENKI